MNTPQPRRDLGMVPAQCQSGKGHQQTARQGSCEQRKKGWQEPNQETVGIIRGGGVQSFRPTHPAEDPPTQPPPPCNLFS